jgi:hypothetical protein
LLQIHTSTAASVSVISGASESSIAASAAKDLLEKNNVGCELCAVPSVLTAADRTAEVAAERNCKSVRDPDARAAVQRLASAHKVCCR